MLDAISLLSHCAFNGSYDTDMFNAFPLPYLTKIFLENKRFDQRCAINSPVGPMGLRYLGQGGTCSLSIYTSLSDVYS